MAARLARVLVVLLIAAAPAVAQVAAPVDLTTSLAQLSSLDFPVRMNAARRLRRVPQAEAVPALTEAVRRHPDEFVRYRALVLLTAFNDKSTGAVMREIVRDRNDRLREVAYKWFEQHPDKALAPALLGALQSEQAEFVRPALVGALAALGDDPQVQRALLAEAARGLDIFRSAVIDALGRHRAAYAAEALAGMASIDGPLTDDVLLALGRIGGPRATPVIDQAAQGKGDASLTAQTARCLLGRECEAAIAALRAASASGRIATVQAGGTGLEALAIAGSRPALETIVDVAAKVSTSSDAMALALATVAVRAPGTVIPWLESLDASRRAAVMPLLKDGFDALEEDYGEEQFFAATRAAYWEGAEGSATRTLLASVIDTLEF